MTDQTAREQAAQKRADQQKRETPPTTSTSADPQGQVTRGRG